MLDQIKSLLQGKIGNELAQKFGLSPAVVQLVTDKVLEVIGGSNSGGMNLGNLMEMGSNLLGGSGGNALVDKLKSNLPNKLAETGQVDSNLAGQITEFVAPKLQ